MNALRAVCVAGAVILAGGFTAGPGTGGQVRAEAAAPAAGPVTFNREIRPILSENCFACHGPSEDRGGDLRLDVRAEAVADRGGYAAIVPGRPDDSEIVRRMLSHDDDEVMPPPRAKKPRLSAAQVGLVRRWIAEGAAYEGHWAFQPLAESVPPAVAGSTWGRNPIDAFVEARLRSEGLAPSPEAPREILLRRAALDLVGLQPSPEDVAAFLADDAPDAYERAVDRLLASPHYGERWGRHWLDQARYADSNGYSIDSPRTMWPWRDWVIDALNRDLPFDRFTIEQLAGDLLPEATKPQRIATGFHRNTMINQEGGTKPEQFRCEAVVDRVNTTGAVWLGLTVGCAQCHSHKYDPLAHAEYFRLYAFFNSDADVNNVADVVEVVSGEITGQAGAVSRADLDAADRRLRDLRAAAAERFEDWLAAWPSIESGASGLANAWEATGVSRVAPAAPTSSLEIAGRPRPTVALRLRIERGADAERDPGEASSPSPAGDKPLVISEITLLADGRPLPLMAAFASVERATSTAAAAIDGRRESGWGVEPADAGGDAAIAVVPREPVPPGVPLTLRLDMSTGGGQTPWRLTIDTTADAALVPLDRAAIDVLAGTIRASRSAESHDGPRESDALKAFATVDLAQLGAAHDREALRRRAVIGATMVMRMLPKARDTFVHRRGDYLDPDTTLGPLAADTPACLPPLRSAPSGPPATRLDLARWLVRPDNPLTPRVTVNRVWMRYFGSGLVETENDFGTQGSPPTHPELLDWLAREFVRGGWSMKALHRLVVTSATYRQASVHRADLAAKDPRNLLLGRQNRIRLDAEAVRDTALVAAGLLSRDVGGPSVHPPQPEGVYAFTQAGKPWPTATGPQRFRRSLYTMFYRSAPHPLFTTFDAPNFSTTCTRRIPSNTPLQSLMLANDPIFLEAADAIALRVVSGAASERVEAMFRLCLSRPPTAGERDTAEEFVRREAESFVGDAPEPWAALARGILNTDAFVTRE